LNRYLEGVDEVPWIAWPLAALATGVALVLAFFALQHSQGGSSGSGELSSLMQDWRGEGEAGTFEIESVRVDGSTLVVRTRLAPRVENTGAALGACLAGQRALGEDSVYVIDANAVRVLDADGGAAASWARGDAVCSLDGVFRE
jgi:hypothetical protein